jgi:hypothetical protein|tara:strand:- start:385 stop:1278 length:894 start_codon:yes stop_codon:yes gene_type:complete
MNDEPTNIEWRLSEAREALVERMWGKVPLVYNHAVLCQLGLPYRSQGNAETFTRVSGNASLRLRAGEVREADGSFRPALLPYGAVARLLLLNLCSESVKRQSPVVEVERSLTAFCRQLGLSTDTRAMRRVKEQANRMSVLQMRIDVDSKTYRDTFQGMVFSKFRVETPVSYQQECLFPSIVEFSTDFYCSLAEHAVPLRLEAVRALSHSSRSLDIYFWLASRLHRVSKPMDIRYTTLRWQFGTPTQEMKSFKRSFRIALKSALMVYPEARVEVIHGGIRLHNSPSPVPRRRAKGLLV